MNEPPVVPEPVLRFVIPIRPSMLLHPAASAGPGMTTISVAETRWTIAPNPASETAIGAWNPRPKIVMGVKGPPSGCTLLLKPP